MNVKTLKENHHELVEYMESEGYSKPYVYQVKNVVRHIIDNAGHKGWTCYADVYLGYVATGKSDAYLRSKRTVLRIFERFNDEGLYPNGNIYLKKKTEEFRGGKYSLLANDFKDILDYYVSASRLRGNKEKTISGSFYNAANFLHLLQEGGIKTLEAITEEAVMSIFIGNDVRPRYSCSYKKTVAAALRECLPLSPDIIGRILTFFPALRMSRKNIQYLTPEESAKVKETLSDEGSDLTLRDRAIGILALYTGLRSCDIAGLAVESIDWGQELIQVSQQKTDVPLSLPLTATVGNAIYDYLSFGRPKTKSDYIFVSYSRPYERLQASSLNSISRKIMAAAAIRQAEGDRKGLHVFRHHLTTKLLGNGIPRPVISEILGHSNPDSIEPYLSADFVHLRECALSIGRFPLGEGVFADA